eukprot:1161995-Pelagomonas_calceolata.AAC.5
MTLDAGRINKELRVRRQLQLCACVDQTCIKDLWEISKDVTSGVEVQLRGIGLNKLVGYVPGPKDTPYEGGRYEVDIDLDEQYPFVPPKMRFVTKVGMLQTNSIQPTKDVVFGS